jgi:chromate transporter
LQTEVVAPEWGSLRKPSSSATAWHREFPDRFSFFAAYLGAVMARAPNGLAGAIIALVAVFPPGLLLNYGMLECVSPRSDRHCHVAEQKRQVLRI